MFSKRTCPALKSMERAVICSPIQILNYSARTHGLAWQPDLPQHSVVHREAAPTSCMAVVFLDCLVPVSWSGEAGCRWWEKQAIIGRRIGHVGERGRAYPHWFFVLGQKNRPKSHICPRKPVVGLRAFMEVSKNVFLLTFCLQSPPSR